MMIFKLRFTESLWSACKSVYLSVFCVYICLYVSKHFCNLMGTFSGINTDFIGTCETKTGPNAAKL